MNKEALLIVAELLEQEHWDTLNFDLSGWATHPFSHEPPTKNFCGTNCCAVGLAALKEKLPGLKTEWQEGFYQNPENREIPIWWMDIIYELDNITYHSWDAIEKYFDLEGSVASHLFSRDSYYRCERNQPLVVAKRIREFVAQDPRLSLPKRDRRKSNV